MNEPNEKLIQTIEDKNNHLTNSDIKRIAKQIERHTQRVNDLLQRIADSDHPHAANVIEALSDNGINPRTDVYSIVCDELYPDPIPIYSWEL